VVGFNDPTQTPGQINHGFLYSGGVYTAINDPSATVNTFAQGINNKDQIVGFYQNYPPSGGVINHGFLYSGGQYIPLDDPSSNLNKIGNSNNTDNFGTAAMGINNKGNIVGYYFDNSETSQKALYSATAITPLLTTL
jgi:hypothetical protein